MANISKGERKMAGVRIPVRLLEQIKKEAQGSGLSLNDYMVMLLRHGLSAVTESARELSQNPLRIV